MNGHYYKKQNKRKNEASFYSPSIFNFHYIYIFVTVLVFETRTILFCNMNVKKCTARLLPS